MLELNNITFKRGEDGNLIPQEVILESLPDKPSVKVRPLTRGKLQEIYTMATSENQDDKIKADNTIILTGLVEPVINEESVKDLMPKYAAAITTAILSVSLNIAQEEVHKQTASLLSDEESELKKN